ncbi:hypothetical protein [Sphingomonas montanisoli]|uniref:NusG-like N-terminal domain-containing protein n=1 Tax=Sphingomonas montanisoli TaxID=2606412 RepID=A0A5D9C1F9_9SPHN|nr:hypothetical protein [Sphingomonas montanisoli]TZG24880.1 hypothetical protein FYJ91_16495 [Sphingomonas montanisoli]
MIDAASTTIRNIESGTTGMKTIEQGNGQAARRWCILRTAGARTLLLQEALASAGIEAWTPRLVVTRRRARTRVPYEVAQPIAPTFVFVRAVHKPELIRALSLGVNPYPAFSFFRHEGRIPEIADGEIAGLRVEEERHRIVRLKKQPHSVKRGQHIRLQQGPYSGLSGVVTDERGRFVAIDLGGSMRVRVASWLLNSNDVDDAQPFTGAAA